MIIKSSSALRNDYSMISDLAHDEAEPIYITKNGGGDLRPGFDSLFFCSTKKDTLLGMSFFVERAKGITRVASSIAFLSQPAVLRLLFQSACTARCPSVHRTDRLHARALPGSISFFSVLRKKDILLGMSFLVERAKGIEPSTQAWEARILPLNYARICGRRSRPTILYYLLFKTSTTLAGILRHFSSEMDASETRRPMASGTRKIPSASSSRLAEAGSSQGIDAKNPPS